MPPESGKRSENLRTALTRSEGERKKETAAKLIALRQNDALNLQVIRLQGEVARLNDEKNKAEMAAAEHEGMLLAVIGELEGENAVLLEDQVALQELVNRQAEVIARYELMAGANVHEMRPQTGLLALGTYLPSPLREVAQRRIGRIVTEVLQDITPQAENQVAPIKRGTIRLA